MYGQFEAHRQLTHIYSKLGFNVHPAGQIMSGPEDLELGDFNVCGESIDQWFEQVV